MMKESGFTLIEVLMALTVFALITALTYGALGSAGDGFKLLTEQRDTQEHASWIGRQLRSDLTYLASAGEQPQTVQTMAIRIINDNRGENELDELWLQVREPGMSGISQVHYFIDEERGHLLRETRLLLAKDSIEPLRWDMGETSSWAVDILDQNGNWRQDWGIQQGVNVWPRAVRVRMKRDALSVERQWLVPIQYGVEL